MVKFWDTSAIIPLTIIETRTAAVRAIVDGDPGIAVWWGTRVECASAMARQMREEHVSPSTVRDARRVITALAREWTEVAPTETLR
jgi:hypothetical protein